MTSLPSCTTFPAELEGLIVRVALSVLRPDVHTSAALFPTRLDVARSSKRKGAADVEVRLDNRSLLPGRGVDDVRDDSSGLTVVKSDVAEVEAVV